MKELADRHNTQRSGAKKVKIEIVGLRGHEGRWHKEGRVTPKSTATPLDWIPKRCGLVRKRLQ